MGKKKAGQPSNTIALNKKARHDYHISERFEAGIALEGWEVKALRSGKAQITESYVIFKNDEAWLLGAQITPLQTASTHIHPDPTRTRKLLLKRREISQLIGATQQKGYTAVCTAMYWKSHLVKVEVALAKGKEKHDKREVEKNRDWDREKQRLLRHTNR